jgi:large subunit ribosomal protein L28
MSQSRAASKITKLPGGFHNISGLFTPKHGIRPKRIDTGLYHGRTVQFGNKISFSEKKSRRKWEPNVHIVKLYSEALDKRLRIKATQKALRCIDKAGGLDNYITKTKEVKLDSLFALRLKKLVLDAQSENQQKNEEKASIEWHAKMLVERAKADPELQKLLLDPSHIVDDTDNNLKVALDKARKQEATMVVQKQKVISKLVRGPRRVSIPSRYLPTKDLREVAEFRLPKEQRDKLRAVDSTRLDLIYRGEMSRSTKKIPQRLVAETGEKKKEEKSSKGILAAIQAATSGDIGSNKLLASIMHNQSEEQATKIKKGDKKIDVKVEREKRRQERRGANKK